jgi:hypothetical protein
MPSALFTESGLARFFFAVVIVLAVAIVVDLVVEVVRHKKRLRALRAFFGMSSEDKP